MGIFSFKTPAEPADRKTPVSTDATASGAGPATGRRDDTATG